MGNVQTAEKKNIKYVVQINFRIYDLDKWIYNARWRQLVLPKTAKYLLFADIFWTQLAIVSNSDRLIYV